MQMLACLRCAKLTVRVYGGRRVFIKAGGSEVVKFSVDVASELKLLGRDFNWVVEPGVFKVMVGGSSADAGGDHCGGDAHGRCAQGQFSVR